MAEKCPRKLNVNGTRILFQFWKEAFEWEQENHSLPLHEKLTEGHFDLTPKSRKRHHLAEDVLDDRMLYLMQVLFYLLP